MSLTPNDRPEMSFSRQAQVFGQEAMDYAQQNPATSEATDLLINTVKSLCTDKRAEFNGFLGFRKLGISNPYAPNISLRYNPRGGEGLRTQNEYSRSLVAATFGEAEPKLRRFKGLDSGYAIGVFATWESVIVDDTETALVRRVYVPKFALAKIEPITAVRPAAKEDVIQLQDALELAAVQEFEDSIAVAGVAILQGNR